MFWTFFLKNVNLWWKCRWVLKHFSKNVWKSSKCLNFGKIYISNISPKMLKYFSNHIFQNSSEGYLINFRDWFRWYGKIWAPPSSICTAQNPNESHFFYNIIFNFGSILFDNIEKVQKIKNVIHLGFGVDTVPVYLQKKIRDLRFFSWNSIIFLKRFAFDTQKIF